LESLHEDPRPKRKVFYHKVDINQSMAMKLEDSLAQHD
jgi:hypothetical protein